MGNVIEMSKEGKEGQWLLYPPDSFPLDFWFAVVILLFSKAKVPIWLSSLLPTFDYSSSLDRPYKPMSVVFCTFRLSYNGKHHIAFA